MHTRMAFSQCACAQSPVDLQSTIPFFIVQFSRFRGSFYYVDFGFLSCVSPLKSKTPWKLTLQRIYVLFRCEFPVITAGKSFRSMDCCPWFHKYRNLMRHKSQKIWICTLSIIQPKNPRSVDFQLWFSKLAKHDRRKICKSAEIADPKRRVRTCKMIKSENLHVLEQTLSSAKFTSVLQLNVPLRII